jgi:beta-galactosidase
MRAVIAWRTAMATLAMAGPLLSGAATRTAVRSASRITWPFDQGWRFSRGDAPGAEKPGFDDRAWRAVDVPHDWAIEGPFDEKNPTGRGGGYLPSGIGFYRKSFTVPEAYARRRAFVELDGVMANSDVWINGVHLGRRPYGYVSLRYELTGHLTVGPGRPNVLAVRTDTTVQPASRWYTGQGIYRHVRMVLTDDVHVEPWGVFVTTPEVSSARALVRIQTAVLNQSMRAREVTLRTTILGPDGRPIGTAEAPRRSVPAGGSALFEQQVTVPGPQLWDLDHPSLYRAVSEVVAGGRTLDDEVTPFGIRELRFDAATGFWLNGRNLKIKGACLHHDGGAVGAAVPRGVWERRLARLREAGVNAVRTAHNPPDPVLLDLLDGMGFLVMDETFDAWTMAKPHAEQGYERHFAEWWERDTADTIRRDRNHPSIVVYSAGNEIHDLWNPELAFRLFRPMRDLIHRLDPTRPVTLGVLRPNVGHIYDNGFAEEMDVIGQNYRENELVAAHQQKPERRLLGTENGHGREAWLALRDNPFYSGQFLWSGIDYLGEADWPQVTHGSGLLDRTGAFRPRTYERQSWWTDRPMVHLARRIAPPAKQATDPGYGPPSRDAEVLFSDWTPRDTSAHEETVEVYSNTEEVELFLNGRSLGAQPRSADDAARVWRVAFEPGTLLAVAGKGGQVAARHEVRTAGPPRTIVLTADRRQLSPHWDEVGFVEAAVVDEHGVLVPSADNPVTFELEGPGAIVAVDNADRASHEPFLARERRAYGGRCLAIVRATAASGRIMLRVSSPGLSGSSVVIEAVPARQIEGR